MIARVKNAFIERLKHLNWMDSETSQGAIKKGTAALQKDYIMRVLSILIKI